MRALPNSAPALRPLIVVTLTIVLAMLDLAASPARAGTPGRVMLQAVRGAPRVAVQPVAGAPALVGASLRAKMARVLRGRGYRVVTTIPGVDDTGRYPALARDHRLTAFVVSDLKVRKTRQTLTIAVWDGAKGFVLGRWSLSGPAKDTGKLLVQGLWKHLGPVLEKARAPEPTVIPFAPPAPPAVN